MASCIQAYVLAAKGIGPLLTKSLHRYFCNYTPKNAQAEGLNLQLPQTTRYRSLPGSFS